MIERQLLAAALALQLGLAQADALRKALQAWEREPDGELPDWLAQRGLLSPSDRTLLDSAIQRRLAVASPGASLAALPISPAAEEMLAPWADEDLRRAWAPPPRPPGPGRAKTEALPPLARDGAGSRYRLLRQHARGGLGEVFVAEDLELRREVALKEIQPRFADDAESCVRFVQEAEITGRLEHPGIVPVYGLGRHADGRPHYAMRFIRGEDLWEAILRFHRLDRVGRTAAHPVPPAGESQLPTEVGHAASPAVAASVPVLPASPAAEPPRQVGRPDFASQEFRQLLRRFVDVCNAVGFAHSRGVLHRDIKPDNIMLGEFGQTLLVDWGLAKQIEAAGGADGRGPIRAGDSVATQAGMAMGTPAYMAPEQAAGLGGQVGPAADIFALGATLFAILAARPPRSGAAAEVLARAAAGEVAAVAEVNPAAPPALAAVCRKAMAANPADRYGSALDLAKDIEAWLADEPVSAWREPMANRLRRWLRLRPRLVAGAAAAAGVAIVALATGDWLLDRERSRTALALQAAIQARADVVAEFRQAEQAVRVSNNIVSFLRDDLLQLTAVEAQHNTDGAEALGKDATLGDLLDRAAAKLDGRFDDDPETEAELRRTVGIAFWQRGEPRKALPHLRRSLRLHEMLFGPDSPETMTTRNALGAALQHNGDLAEALLLLADNHRRRVAVLGELHGETMVSRNNYATALQLAGRVEEALPLLRASVVDRERLLGPQHRDTLVARNNLATALMRLGKTDEALPLLTAGAEQLAAELGQDHPSALIARGNVAAAYFAARRWSDAVPRMEACVEEQARVLGADHPTTLRTKVNLAESYNAAGRAEDAIRVMAETLRLAEARPEGIPASIRGIGGNLAFLRESTGHAADAEAFRRKALAAEEARAPGSADAANAAIRLANNLLAQRRYEEAATVARQVVAMREALRAAPSPKAAAWQVASAKSLLGACLSAAGKFAEAEPLLLEAHRALTAPDSDLPADYRGTTLADAAARLSKHFADRGDAKSAAAWRERAEEAAAAAHPRGQR